MRYVIHFRCYDCDLTVGTLVEVDETIPLEQETLVRMLCTWCNGECLQTFTRALLIEEEVKEYRTETVGRLVNLR